MLNPFNQPELIKAEVFMSYQKIQDTRQTAWSNPNRQGAKVNQFLEGSSFDRKGNLYVTDIPFGRILRYLQTVNGILFANMMVGQTD